MSPEICCVDNMAETAARAECQITKARARILKNRTHKYIETSESVRPKHRTYEVHTLSAIHLQGHLLALHKYVCTYVCR